MVIFGPKPWVYPFGKMSIFRPFKLVVFIAQNGVFSFENIVKNIFLAYFALKKKLGKQPFLDQNDGLTPLKKCQFFEFLNFLILQPRKAFFVVEYGKRGFPGLYCLKKKIGKNGHFGPKRWVNPFGKISILRLLKLLVFIAQTGVFMLQNMVKDIFLAYIA